MSIRIAGVLVLWVAVIVSKGLADFNGNGGSGGIFKTDEQPTLAKPFAGKCEERNGRYSMADQCDKYVECTDGEPKEALCPDGLMFSDKVKLFTYPCQYPIDVDCGSRTKLQPAQPTEDCPRQFGYFKLGDDSHCGKFMNCANGRSFTFDCPEGLAFSMETYRCDWADQVTDCNAEKYLGFTCPEEKTAPGLGPGATRFYTSPDNCQRYYVCLEGRPRMYNCGVGNGFNELTSGCDAAENVTTCPEYAAARSGVQLTQLL